MVYPASTSNLDRFPVQSNMAMIALLSEIAIVLVILIMTTDAGCRQNHFAAYRCIVTIDTLESLVLPVKLEVGFVVVEIPVLPVASVVASFASSAKGAFVHVLLRMARRAIRLRLLEYHRQMTFFALGQNMLSGKLETRNPVIEFSLFPRILMMAGFAFFPFLAFMFVVFVVA